MKKGIITIKTNHNCSIPIDKSLVMGLHNRTMIDKGKKNLVKGLGYWAMHRSSINYNIKQNITCIGIFNNNQILITNDIPPSLLLRSQGYAV